MSPSFAVERSKMQLPILKITPGGVVKCVLGDVGPLWYGVHWAGNRQHLCSGYNGSSCPLCGLTESRVIGMTLVEVEIGNTRRPLLLEVSPLAWSNLESRCRFGGFDLVAGVRTTLSRPRARGMLRLEPEETVERSGLWLDAERRLLGGWAVLYGLPLPMLDETFAEFQSRVVVALATRAAVAAAKA